MNNIIKTERLDLVPLDLNDQNQLIDILTNPQMTTYRESDFTISEIFSLVSRSAASSRSLKQPQRAEKCLPVPPDPAHIPQPLPLSERRSYYI